MDGDSHHHGQLPASAAPVVSSASRDQRKQQLAQLQQYLQKIGVAGKTNCARFPSQSSINRSGLQG